MTNSIKYLSYILSIVSIILTKACSNIQTNQTDIYESLNNISLNSSYKDIYNQTEKINYFLIIQNNTDIINSTNYIKIQIKNLNNEINHNVISYYHNDSSFSERKQLSHNISNITYIILTKDQIENDFYISIEFDIIPCLYELEILLLNNIEFYLGEQYSYFVTKENKIMLFDIIGKLNINNSNNKNNNTIFVWAKGNKEISLNICNITNTYYKHPKYNMYIIDYGKGNGIIKNNNFLFNLEIHGKEGDLINIGTLFFDSSDLCSNYFIDKQEIMGFLKKNLKDKNCYKFPQNINNILLQKGVYENKEINISYNVNHFCVSLPEGFDDVIYTLYSFQANNDKNNNLIRFSPLVNNIEYFNEINKNMTIGLIPIKQNEDLNYISYFLNPLNGKYKVGIYICETYPLCYIDSNITYEEIKYINSFSLTYSKSEDDIYLNQIGKKRKIIIIKSENNLNEKNQDKNLFYLTIYNQNYINLLKPDTIYTKYTRKTIIENYLIKYNNSNNENIKSIYIFIELISGYIEINDFEPQIYKRYNKEKKYLYIININNNTSTKISFKIDSKTNSFYKIIYIKNINDYEIKFNFFDGNYLFNLNNKNKIIINPNKFNSINTLRFVSFYSINCSFNIKYDNFINRKIDSNNINFYQKIYTNKEINNKSLSYEISKNGEKNNNNSSQSCLFYMSTFRLNSINSNYLNGIILSNNNSQYFIFNNKINYTFNFIYLFTNSNNNLYIEIKLFDIEKYELILFYNENINDTIDIKSDMKIKIDYNILNNICLNSYQICFIKFSIKSNRNLNESKIVINPNFDGNNLNIEGSKDIGGDNKIEDDDEKFFDINNPLFILVIVGTLFFILIIIVVIITIYFTCKNKGLIEEVNSISFKYDDNIYKNDNDYDKDNNSEKYDNILEENFSDIDSEKH